MASIENLDKNIEETLTAANSTDFDREHVEMKSTRYN